MSTFNYLDEYAVRNPFGGGVMTVPNGTRAEAEKMAAYVKGSVVLSRVVSEWVEMEIRDD